MFKKKGMELPQSTVIVALILIVLVIIILVFVVGGFGTIGSKLTELFHSQTGQSSDIAIKTCDNLCQGAKSLSPSSQPNSAYCKQTFMIKDDNNAKQPPVKKSCGNNPLLSSQGVESDLGVECPD